MDDKELVALSLKEKERYGYLMQRYEKKLLKYITRFSGVGGDDAQDILQDTFLKVYRNLNAYNGAFSFSSWIYRIAHNETIGHLRKLKSRPQVVNSEDSNILIDIFKSDPGFFADIENQHLAEKLGEIINTLDSKYREVIALVYLEDKSYKEVSDILKKPVSTVGTLVLRAKRQLKEKIKKSNYF
ncbi:MAG: RNA polymerase sigma factor [Candidatus Staskawiczbacteria bacterium]